jgi:diaminopropionate ammonia-lyase
MMNMTWFVDPAKRVWRCDPVPPGALAFHSAMPGYAKTPLSELPSVAAEPGVSRVFVKDESSRLGLPADTPGTVMAGLNCGTPSSLAWPVVQGGLDAAVAVSDSDANQAMRDLEKVGVSSGPCGAASLAGVRLALSSAERRVALGINESSVVVLISTEGRASGS